MHAVHSNEQKASIGVLSTSAGSEEMEGLCGGSIKGTIVLFRPWRCVVTFLFAVITRVGIVCCLHKHIKADYHHEWVWRTSSSVG